MGRELERELDAVVGEGRRGSRWRVMLWSGGAHQRSFVAWASWLWVARPTPKEPHQGVVAWMSSLENVASIALEIQPASQPTGGGAGGLVVAIACVC